MENRIIYLARHGEITPAGKKCFIGQIDLPLNEKGIYQAKSLQQDLSCVQLENIYCSDLQRGIQTATIIAEKHHKSPVVCKDLREISLGEWEGCTFEKICHKYPDEFKKRGQDILNYCPPGGESFADCYQRIWPAFQQILQTSKKNICIVGHAGINRLLLATLMKVPLENLFVVCQDYGCLNVILQGNFGFRLRTLNKTYRLLMR